MKGFIYEFIFALDLDRWQGANHVAKNKVGNRIKT